MIPADQLQGPSAEALALRPRDYFRIFWSRKWSIIAIIGVIVGGAYLYSARQPDVYVSQGQVLVRAINYSSQPPDPFVVVNMSTEARIATSAEVSERAAALLKAQGERTGGGLGAPSVDSDPETNILSFQYSSGDPEVAQERTQAFIEAYLEFRREEAQEELERSRAPLEGEIALLTDQLQSVQAALTATDDASEQAALIGRFQDLTARRTSKQQNLDQLALPENIREGEIIENASFPTEPTSPRPARTAGLAFFAAVLVAAAQALFRERWDTRLKTTADVEAYAGAPVLAVVPRGRGWRRFRDPALVTVNEPSSQASEAYRGLRTKIVLAASRQRLATFLVTSATAGEGKSVTAANLGVVLAQAGHDVVVVSADLRRPSLHRLFGINPRTGLSNILAGELPPRRAVVRTKVENLSFIGSGALPSNPAELLSTLHRHHHVLLDLREMAELVLMDAPPVLPVADALTIAPHVDAVILVVDGRKTTMEELVQARTLLDQMQAPPLCVVLNNAAPSQARTYGSTSYYGEQTKPEAPIQRPITLPATKSGEAR